MLREACEGTMRTTAMIMLILVAATFLSFVVTAVGIGREVTSLITDSGLTPMQTMWLIIALYLVLGMFMESLSMMIATVPIITPGVISMRSEEHTSELQSLIRISYGVFCLKNKKRIINKKRHLIDLTRHKKKRRRK